MTPAPYTPTPDELADLEAARAAHREAEAVCRALDDEIVRMEARIRDLRYGRVDDAAVRAREAALALAKAEDRLGVSLPAQLAALRAWVARWPEGRAIVIREDGRVVAGLEGRGEKVRVFIECWRDHVDRWHPRINGERIFRKGDTWERGGTCWHDAPHLLDPLR